MRVRLSLIAVLAGALSLGLMACNSDGNSDVTDADTGTVGTDTGDTGSIDIPDVGPGVSSDFGPGCPIPSSSGTKEGSFVTPIQLKGYPYPAQTSSWGTIDLYRDYCDPTGAKNKLLWISVSGLFCGPCKAEAPYKAQVCENLRGSGLRCLDVVGMGLSASVAATNDDVITWGLRDGRTNSAGTMIVGNTTLGVPGGWNAAGAIAIDKMASKFAAFTGQNSVPINVLIDLTTMKVIESSPGTPVQPGLDTFTTWIRGYLDKIQ